MGPPVALRGAIAGWREESIPRKACPPETPAARSAPGRVLWPLGSGRSAGYWSRYGSRRDADLSSAWVFGRGSCLYRIGVSQLSHLPELLNHLGQPLDGKAQLLGGTAAAVECPGHGVDVAASLIRKGDGRFRLLLSGDGSRTIPGSRTHPNR